VKAISSPRLALGAVVAIIIVLAVIAGIFYLQRPAPQQVLRIGVIMELTGDLARDGIVCKRGYDIWHKVVEQKGGVTIGGVTFKVELIYYDTASDPGRAATAAEKAVADKVDILLGPYSSSNTLGAIPVVNKYGIPMFAGSPESHKIPEQKSPWVFQTLLTTKESPLAFKVVLERFKGQLSTAALIAASDAFSQGLAEAYRNLFKDLGIKIVLDETFPVDITDLKPLISKISTLNPDVLAVAGHPTHHILAVKASKDIGFNPKIMMVHYGIDSPEFLKEVAGIAEGVLGLIQWTPAINWKDPIFGNVNEFLKVWRETYPGIDPDYTAVSCAATASYVVELLRTLNLKPPLDKSAWDKIRTAAETTRIETILGPIKYSTDPAHWHVNTELIPHVAVVQIQGGKLVTVSPEAAKQAEILFPKPPWR
jgi:branched-chain amino acid transport system substrate-binding protein